MIYMRFTGINYYKLAVEKDRDSIFTTITNHMETRLKGGVTRATKLLQLATKSDFNAC